MDQPTMTADTRPRRGLRFTKHHGAGNDFLVLADPEDRMALPPDEVRAVCDRRFGVGADGLIRITAGREGAELSMDLVNADGSAAEMSGNGMRCLAQAAVRAGMVAPPAFTVSTGAGHRAVRFRGTGDGADWASVDMGAPRLGAAPTALAFSRARVVDMGNPHLVVAVDDPTAVEVTEAGTKLQAEFPEGVNVEFVTVGPGRDQVTLRVFERGVGETLACGTGSVAAAAALHEWGAVGAAVDVHSPGGTLRVELGATTAVLSGPVVFVADVDLDPAAVMAGRGG
jgi:diaminopimelate epimerase